MTNLEAYENLLEAARLVRLVEREYGKQGDIIDQILGCMVCIKELRRDHD